ncbi:MAG: galactokinase [Proteobacteria bacterium]|nr:MAG: galactokinase [Pseudomonadota bacterium]
MRIEALLADACDGLQRAFGRTPDPQLQVQAPGRVNLIGEYTDFNGGLVLPLAIDRGTLAVAARRDDGLLRVHSATVGASGEIDPARLTPGRGWLDYVAGVAFAFRSEGLAVPGLDVALASDLPRESGLSSSASLEVAIATLFDVATDAGLDGAARARLAHRAENEFVGVPCGRMDQLASALGRRDAALRIDCESYAVRAVPLPSDRVRVLIVDSGVRRQLTGGDYGRRRAECEEGLALARAHGIAPPDAATWRAVDPAQLPALERALPPALFRRARHVLTENGRVDATCEALFRGDAAAAGALLQAGMRSLRDDFEVSRPELDFLCESGDATPGCFGSRLTGAGFGGCTIHLVEPSRADEVARAIQARFAARFARTPPALLVTAAEGAAPVRK